MAFLKVNKHACMTYSISHFCMFLKVGSSLFCFSLSSPHMLFNAHARNEIKKRVWGLGGPSKGMHIVFQDYQILNGLQSMQC